MNNEQAQKIYEAYLAAKTGVDGKTAAALLNNFLDENDDLLRGIFETNTSVQVKMQTAFVEGMVAILEYGKRNLESAKGGNPFPPTSLN